MHWEYYKSYEMVSGNYILAFSNGSYESKYMTFSSSDEYQWYHLLKPLESPLEPLEAPLEAPLDAPLDAPVEPLDPPLEPIK